MSLSAEGELPSAEGGMNAQLLGPGAEPRAQMSPSEAQMSSFDRARAMTSPVSSVVEL